MPEDSSLRMNHCRGVIQGRCTRFASALVWEVGQQADTAGVQKSGTENAALRHSGREGKHAEGALTPSPRCGSGPAQVGGGEGGGQGRVSRQSSKARQPTSASALHCTPPPSSGMHHSSRAARRKPSTQTSAIVAATWHHQAQPPSLQQRGSPGPGLRLQPRGAPRPQHPPPG